MVNDKSPILTQKKISTQSKSEQRRDKNTEEIRAQTQKPQGEKMELAKRGSTFSMAAQRYDPATGKFTDTRDAKRKVLDK